jgi:hypothetical protein
MQYLLLALRCLIGATFLVALASKISSRDNYRRFVDSLEAMQVVPLSWAKPTAPVVVVLEIGVCALIVDPQQGSGIVGFLLAAGLLSAFAGGMLVSMRQGVQVACRCFGPSNAPIGRRHLARNVLLIASAVVGILVAAEGNSDQIHPGGAVAAAGVGLLLAAIVATIDEIAALFGASTRPSGSH